LFKVKGFVHSINCVEHLAKRNEETSFTKKAVFKLTDFKSVRRRGLKAFKVKPSLFNSSFTHVEVYFRCCRLGSSALRVFNYVFLTILVLAYVPWACWLFPYCPLIYSVQEISLTELCLPNQTLLLVEAAELNAALICLFRCSFNFHIHRQQIIN